MHAVVSRASLLPVAALFFAHLSCLVSSSPFADRGPDIEAGALSPRPPHFVRSYAAAAGERLKDSDADGIPDDLEDELAHAYFPFYSLSAHDRCPLHGVLYRLSPHPRSPDKILIRYDVLYQHDCGLRGHVGDSELFSVLADPSVPAPQGILAVRTVAHHGTLCESVMTCGRLPGCKSCSWALRDGQRYPVVFSSANKHGSYLSEEICSFSFVCDFGGCSRQAVAAAPPMTNAGEPGNSMVADLTTSGFVRPELGWTEPQLQRFDPWGEGRFGKSGHMAKDLTDKLYEIDPRSCER
ncbi:MAG: hypothetical protein HY898_30715 [Deltaproteobacteria bacterium]|nr:hypothetical protein [Deltaproteobacteria bacterium]